MDLERTIEAILFWKAEPVSMKKLAQLVGTDMAGLEVGLTDLEQNLRGRGLALVRTEDEVMLGTAKDLSPIIEELTKDELTRDLGKAGLETLSIILYQGPISRANVDYIRGVNSQFVIRTLLVRGLIERVDNPQDQRSFLYKPTLQLLANLGVSKITELPEYAQVRSDIENFRASAGAAEETVPAANPPSTDTSASSDATIAA